MRSRRFPSTYLIVSLPLVLSLWVGSYLFLRSKYGSVSSSIRSDPGVELPSIVPIGKNRTIWVDFAGEHADDVANTLYAPLIVVDRWYTDVEVSFIAW